MPIDSRDKRASALFIGLPAGRILPNRDGAITATDFEQTAFSYSGVQSGLPYVPTGEGFSVTGSRLRRLFLLGVRHDANQEEAQRYKVNQGRPWWLRRLIPR